MHNNRRLVIDIRKAHDAGIGTYIREVVPKVCYRIHGLHCHFIAAEDSATWVGTFSKSLENRFSISYVSSKPFSIGEQYTLRRIIRNDDLFWATSLAHPLFFSKKYIATVHDVAQVALPSLHAGGVFTKTAARLYFKSLEKTATSLLFVSEFSRSEFFRYIGIPASNTAIAHLGVNEQWFQKRTAPQTANKRPFFVSVSSVRPHKNFEFLIRSFLRVIDLLPHDLIVIGQYQSLGPLNELIASASAIGRIRFLGRVDDETLRSKVSGAEALIFPSLYEGFGLPTLEAMASGCPVIASEAGSIKEVCGDAALYFDPTSEESLCRALLSFSQINSTDRAAIVNKGLEKAKSYSWDRAASIAANIINQLI